MTLNTFYRLEEIFLTFFLIQQIFIEGHFAATEDMKAIDKIRLQNA